MRMAKASIGVPQYSRFRSEGLPADDSRSKKQSQEKQNVIDRGHDHRPSNHSPRRRYSQKHTGTRIRTFCPRQDTDIMGRLMGRLFEHRCWSPKDAKLQPDLCQLWGKISHPTTVDLCVAMAAVRNKPREDNFLSRVDIKSVYPRVSMDPKHKGLISTLVPSPPAL